MNIQEIINILTLTLPLLIPGLILIIILKYKKLNVLNYPLDLKKFFKGKRIFGDNKTFRGIFIMISVSILVTYILNLLMHTILYPYIHPIFKTNPIVLGLIYSISYTIGELINSFSKRRLNVSPGKINTKFKNIQIFFDLSDGILVAVISITIFSIVSINEALIAGFFGIIIHYSTDILMKNLNLKK